MALHIGHRAWDSRELLREGAIPKNYIEDHDISVDTLPFGSLTQSQINNPPQGVVYVVSTEDNVIYQCGMDADLWKKYRNPPKNTKFFLDYKNSILTESQRQLPAKNMTLQIVFDSQGTGDLDSPSVLVGGVFVPLFFTFPDVNYSNPTCHFTYQVCDAKTYINKPIKITKAILDTAQIITDPETKKKSKVCLIELDVAPLAVFAAVKEKKKTDPKTKVTTSYGIEFTDWELAHLGDTDSWIWGDTNIDGQYGGRQGAKNKVVPPWEENIFKAIVADYRKYIFRADANIGQSYSTFTDSSKPPMSNSIRDGTTKYIQIQIDKPGYEIIENDIVYISLCAQTNKRLRTMFRHEGKMMTYNIVFDPILLPGVVIPGPVTSSSQYVHIWHFKIAKWWVPKKIADYKVLSNFKLTPSDLKNIDEKKNLDKYEQIEGWRISETIPQRPVQKCWMADERGILYVEIKERGLKPEATVVFPASKIRDQEWFKGYIQYLKDNGIKTKNIQDEINYSSSTFFLYDQNSNTNALAFDVDKIAYYRPFALYLMKCSSFNPNDTTKKSGIGFPLLDIKDVNGIDDTSEEILKKYDLSFATFTSQPTGPGLNGKPPVPDKPRTGVYRSSTYLAPEINKAWWYVQTPIYWDSYNARSRVYIEAARGCFKGYIYVATELSGGSLTIDRSPKGEEFYLGFNDEKINQAISLHRFKDSVYSDRFSDLKTDASRNHVRPVFDHDKFKWIGYNRLLGTMPSYSEGQAITTEDFFMSVYDPNYKLNIQDFLIEEDVTSSVNISNTPWVITLPTDNPIQKIRMTYTLKNEDLPKDKDRFISLSFAQSDSAITNLLVPFDKGKEVSIDLNCRWYKGASVTIFGDILSFIDSVKEIKVTTAKDSTLFDKYKMSSQQLASTFLGDGTYTIFFANESSNNISLGISPDYGKTWVRYDDIILLTEGETANYPYIINRNKKSPVVDLFYKLNDSYLMYKPVNLTLLRCEDAMTKYTPPAAFDGTTDNEGFLAQYTEEGKKLRKTASFFVAGNKNDIYFQNQMAINKDIDKKNESISGRDGRKYKRFDFSDRLGTDHMDKEFEGRYTVDITNSGQIRLFFLYDSKLNVKMTPDLLTWEYVVKDVPLHKDFVYQTVEEIDLDNIQVITPKSQSDKTLLFYYHRDMLFMRELPNDYFVPKKNKDNTIDNSDIVKKLTVTKEGGVRPIFIVGMLPEDIKTEKLKIEDEIAAQSKVKGGLGRAEIEKASDLAIFIPYSRDMLDKFNSDFSLDSDTQPVGFMTKIGLPRLFYKDSNGLVDGLTINSGFKVLLDVMFTEKKE